LFAIHFFLHLGSWLAFAMNESCTESFLIFLLNHCPFWGLLLLQIAPSQFQDFKIWVGLPIITDTKAALANKYNLGLGFGLFRLFLDCSH
jgi:hypothetical protein